MFENDRSRSLVALFTILASVGFPGSARGQVSDQEAVVTAQRLASRLETSPPASTWVRSASREAGFDSDVNQLVILASLLAHEMSLGKPKESTKAIYMSLRDAGKRILIRANASPEVLPAGDVEEYTKLMSALERYYAE